MLLLAVGATACGGAADPPPSEEGGDPPAEGAGDPALERLAEAWMRAEAMIVYRQTATGGGGLRGRMTLYWSPPGSWRGDFESGGGSSSVIVTPDHTYTCSPGSCLEFPSLGEGGSAPFFPGAFVDPTGITEGLPTGGDLERSRETIAGVKATCFRAPAAQGGGQWCFSEEGLLLRARVSSPDPQGGGDYALEAVEVSRKIPPDAFEPPFPVSEPPA